MNAYEATKVVLARLQSVDPDNAAKIMGVLLSQDNGGAEMIRMALAPDAQLIAAAAAARRDITGTPPSPPPPQPRMMPSPLSIPSPSYPLSASEAADSLLDDLSFLSDVDGASGEGLFPFDGHRRSSSVSDVLNGGAAGYGWKPCLYYMRGFCKNGSACRFVHGDDLAAFASIEQELQLRSKSQRFAPSSAFTYSPTGGGSASLPGSPSGKCLSLLLQQQLQNENQRTAAAAAAAAALILNGDDAQRFMSRSRHLDMAALLNPGARQIYLTFPADSTFREEDVSSYFSIFGPVQDVRIPYQQKRMFGFVTFVHPETVRLILAKGNPHFICDARVLVKPYKEKGKVPDKFRKPCGDFAGCLSPTGLVDPRDPFDLHQLGARLMHSNSANELLFRRKLAEEQAAAELQIELQARRLMNLHLLDLKRGMPSPTSPVSPFGPHSAMLNGLSSSDSSSPPESGDEPVDEQVRMMSSLALHSKAGADKGESNSDGSDSQESVEHNLPDSPFASPTKAMFALDMPSAGSDSDNGINSTFLNSAVGSRSSSPFLSASNGTAGIGGNFRLPSAMFDIPSPKPYFPVSRLAADHGAVGM